MSRGSAFLVALLLGLPLLGVQSPAVAVPGETSPEPTTPGVTPAAGVGDWQVESVAPDRHLVSWTAPDRLPVGSDRPTVTDSAGTSLGTTTVADDGRTVQVTVSGPKPDVAALDVMLSGDRLDEPGFDRTASAAPRMRVETPGATLPVDPAVPGPHAVVSDDYTLTPVKLAGMRQPIEMVGHVVEPAPEAVTGARPLVVFLHGRHEYCYAPKGREGDTWTWPCKTPLKEIPSHLGYDYIQRVLASQGFTTVSIRVNGINAQDDNLADGGAGARADIVDAHLRYWEGLALSRQVDMQRVVLVGHSRGGEGVNRVSLRTPLGGAHTVVGQVLLAPTDFGSQSAPYVPTVSVLPYCDGDVSDLQGQRFVDFGRDLARTDTALKSAVMVFGANHNFFNTEWTPQTSVAPSNDDWFGRKNRYCGRKHADRLSPAEQRRTGVALVAGAARLFTRDDQQFLPLYDGTTATVASLGDAVIRSAAVGGGRDVRRPGLEVSLGGGATAQARLCRAVRSSRTGSNLCGARLDENAPNWPEAAERLPERTNVEVGWTAANQTVTLSLGGELDLSAGRLDLRTTVDPTRGAAQVAVRLRDGDGGTSATLPVRGGSVAALPGGRSQSRRWARTMTVDTATATGVDLARVTSVELISLGGTARVWIHDLASVPAALAAVPSERLPVVNFGSAAAPEGNAGTGSGDIPFTVQGAVTAPAQVKVLVSRFGEITQQVSLALVPGQTEGSLPVTFPSNRTHDDEPVVIETMAVAESGATTGDYLGRLKVIDDDPAPVVRVKRSTATVAEGKAIRIVIKLSAPTTDGRWYSWRFVKGPGRAAQVGDLTAAWRRGKGLRNVRLPLHQSGYYGNAEVPAGKRRAVILLPIARDGLVEGTETITVKVKGHSLKAKSISTRVKDR